MALKKISAKRLSKAAMAAGEERRIKRVIDGSDLKEWVGIGWIVLRRATAADRRKYPAVDRSDD